MGFHKLIISKSEPCTIPGGRQIYSQHYTDTSSASTAWEYVWYYVASTNRLYNGIKI